uniref:Uncharacterized protein n=1 Tax=Triticum urartu TaxID=4572 RepID=A0A8R7QCJ4_TRIUA
MKCSTSLNRVYFPLIKCSLIFLE